MLKGMSLVPIDNNIRKRYRIPLGVDGVLIERIEPGSQAEKDGFQVGDVIIQVENRTVTSLNDIREALQKKEGTAKRVYVNRNGMILLLIVN